MITIRKDEPNYAFIPNVGVPEKNSWGRGIDTVSEFDALVGKSLNINYNSEVSDNPNRYKQHGFHFTADNCIGCHACEAACSEKNNLPAHISFRSVGYVEGGTYPDYTRLNISMACNHCDDPVCLKGCPTRAYTKYAEYGAVLQDPDICFGCGYCTWVCPYNAPQLDPIEGQVSKCNMCVDRLEIGLKPACVAACLAGALDFGVIETTPDNRVQKKVKIPGFPSPEITQPNIRFQQIKSLPREMIRSDSMAVKYQRQGLSSDYMPILDKAKGCKHRHWNFKKLFSTHENAHIIFTISTQLVVGAFLLLALGSSLGLSSMELVKQQSFHPVMVSLLLILSYGTIRLNLHLGKPMRFYRGFYNWRWSPVTREIAGVSLLSAGIAATIVLRLLEFELSHWLPNIAVSVAIIGALIGLYYMVKIYRIPARPFWNHWQTASSFIGTSLVLGAMTIALIHCINLGLVASQNLVLQLALVIIIGLSIEAMGLIFHARDLTTNGEEGAVSHNEQTTRYCYSYMLRNMLLGLNLGIAVYVSVFGLVGDFAVVIGLLFILSSLTMTAIGRALFYVVVIPTTMPGAFFWRNKGFEEHARATGLAQMPQVGVIP